MTAVDTAFFILSTEQKLLQTARRQSQPSAVTCNDLFCRCTKYSSEGGHMVTLRRIGATAVAVEEQ